MNTLENIEARLAELGDAPSDLGTLHYIIRRPATDMREVLDSATFTLEEGLVGDNWRTRGNGKGGEANIQAQVTLMSVRMLEALTPDRERWLLAGDQLLVDFDLSESNLPAGQRLQIGSVILEVSALPHTGCAKFTERFGEGAIRAVSSPEGRAARRRGVNVRVIQGGTLTLSDTITKI